MFNPIEFDDLFVDYQFVWGGGRRGPDNYRFAGGLHATNDNGMFLWKSLWVRLDPLVQSRVVEQMGNRCFSAVVFKRSKGKFGTLVEASDYLFTRVIIAETVVGIPPDVMRIINHQTEPRWM